MAENLFIYLFFCEPPRLFLILKKQIPEIKASIPI